MKDLNLNRQDSSLALRMTTFRECFVILRNEGSCPTTTKILRWGSEWQPFGSVLSSWGTKDLVLFTLKILRKRSSEWQDAGSEWQGGCPVWQRICHSERSEGSCPTILKIFRWRWGSSAPTSAKAIKSRAILSVEDWILR